MHEWVRVIVFTSAVQCKVDVLEGVIFSSDFLWLWKIFSELHQVTIRFSLTGT